MFIFFWSWLGGLYFSRDNRPISRLSLGRLVVRLLPGTYLMIVEKTNSEEKRFRFNLFIY